MGWWRDDAVAIRDPIAETGWLHLDKLKFSIVYVVVLDFVVLLQAEKPVRGCVPNSQCGNGLHDWLFCFVSILFTQYWTCFPPVLTPMVSLNLKVLPCKDANLVKKKPLIKRL